MAEQQTNRRVRVYLRRPEGQTDQQAAQARTERALNLLRGLKCCAPSNTPPRADRK